MGRGLLVGIASAGSDASTGVSVVTQVQAAKLRRPNIWTLATPIVLLHELYVVRLLRLELNLHLLGLGTILLAPVNANTSLIS
jgi:hypothetical protein